jgi:hypothetical protein
MLLSPQGTRTVTAHEDGYAIHVWADGGEGEAEYAKFVQMGVEGYMASEPGRLAAYLCSARVPRPDGSPRCAYPADPPADSTPAKKCKKGQKLKKNKCVKKKKKRKKKGRR